MCRGCQADCCAMLLEVKIKDLARLDLCTEDEEPKKVFQRLKKQKIAQTYRAATGMFLMQSKANGDCQFLDSQTRLCTVYEKRPDTCRRFPTVGGPRPAFCPSRPK
jgi:Fe-S-cluster containining protein